MTDIIDRVVRAAGFDDVSRAAEERAIRGRISPLRAFADVDDLRGLRRMALVLELRALDEEGAAAEELYEQAFTFWRLLLERQAELGEPDLYEAGLRLAMSGTLAKRVTEVRQVLGTSIPSAERLAEALASPAAVRDVNWRDQVLRDVRLSLILLTRKNGGWADIALALALLRGLRDRQQALESEFLDQVEQQRHAALDLVGLYHLAQMVTVVGRFLETGDGVTERITVQLDRHASRAAQAFEAAGDMDTETETRLVHRSLTALVSNSIWSQLYGLGQSFSDFAQQVARHASSPLLELWPSQQEALQSNFFDTYRRALLVQMPTSAGKSLLAKLAILQTNALYPTATIAYVVPTRVLVNQVTDDLRVDLEPLGITVEQAVPVFEMDPSENQLLTAETSVIVTTAEKLDLLIRTNHPAMQELSMVIVDEAHNLNDGERGARLELVLATIQRDRPGSRYLLLSPFLPNGRDLVRWLGGTRQLDPITVSWRPNKRVVGALEIRSEGRGRNFIDLVTANAVEQSNLPAGEHIELIAVGNKPSGIGAITRSAVDALSHRGGTTLVVVYGRMKAAQRAQEIAATKPAVPGSALREATRRFLEAELGAGNALSRVLEHRVAYHHAGMSLEARRLVERLIRDGEVDVVCGTTTLAQGVNFPISNVIVEGRTSGRDGKKYSHAQFWNMAGRAGRGLHTDLGVVAYPVHTAAQRKDWVEFFEHGAEKIASQLAELVTAADAIGQNFNFANLRDHPTLSSFLQYLAHAMHVGGAASASDDIEDLLRSSLLFQDVQDQDAGGGRRLIELCRRYLDSLQGRQGLVALADGTGFSTPSVGHIQRAVTEAPTEFTPESWEPSRLFGSDVTDLTERIQLIASVPEMTLAPDENAGPFNAERIAQALRAWVGGASIAELGEEFGAPGREGEDKITMFASYLYGRLSTNASWGLGALEWVSLAHQNATGDSDLLLHVPSMVYFGVDTREAIWMRMVGLPRSSARAAGYLWESSQQGAPQSYGQLRSWIDSRSLTEWSSALRITRSPGAAEDHQLIWNALTGRATE